jgi:hypothetical protein
MEACQPEVGEVDPAMRDTELTTNEAGEDGFGGGGDAPVADDDGGAREASGSGGGGNKS